MTRTRLKQLEKVVDGVADATLFQLKSANKTCRALERDITELDAERARMIHLSTKDPSLLLLGFTPWLRWAEKRKAELNMSLSRARADREGAKRKAVKALGRSQALKMVLDRKKPQGG